MNPYALIQALSEACREAGLALLVRLDGSVVVVSRRSFP